MNPAGTAPARSPFPVYFSHVVPMHTNASRTTAIQRERGSEEAELAVIKEERLLQNLVTLGEHTMKAAEQLARLRNVLKRLAAPVYAPDG
jgi:hypothetical protein